MPVLAKLKFQQYGAIPLAKTYETKHDRLLFKGEEQESPSTSRLNWEVIEQVEEESKALSFRNPGVKLKRVFLK